MNPKQAVDQTIAMLLVGAWLLLTGAAVLVFIKAGVPPAIAMLPTVVANAALVLLLRDRLRREAKYRRFLQTVRDLRASQASGRA